MRADKTSGTEGMAVAPRTLSTQATETAGPAGLQLWLGQASPVLPPAFALVEMAVLVALVMLEYFWDGFPNLTRINPHPYWIAVLLLSLQYGTVSGLIAASIAIIGTVLIGMPEPDIEERYFNYLIRVWTQPVLWLLVAMLLGTFRARQIEQRDELLLQAENLRMRGATLLDHATNLRARCTMLERRIAMRETTDTSKLLAALARLSDAGPGRWADALDATLRAGFPKSQISLYAIDGASARVVLTHRAAGIVNEVTNEIGADHLLLASIKAGRSLSVVDAADDAFLRGSGVAAVPIFAPVTGQSADAAGQRVIGFLKAEVLPPSQLDASTTQRLSVVAAHLAPALQRGLISPVATAPDRADTEAIPQLRRWRLSNLWPGDSRPDGTNG
jgi:hypothetical protein